MQPGLKEKTISMRSVHRDLATITKLVEMGQNFIVEKNGTPVFKIVPIKAKKKGSLRDIEKIAFDGPGDLSQNIDKYVYGV